jgi:hypothetical protein
MSTTDYTDYRADQLSRLRSWCVYHANRLAEQFFATDDRTAQAHGWQVTRTRSGWGRVYRDPRFDVVSTHPGTRTGIEDPR